MIQLVCDRLRLVGIVVVLILLSPGCFSSTETDQETRFRESLEAFIAEADARSRAVRGECYEPVRMLEDEELLCMAESVSGSDSERVVEDWFQAFLARFDALEDCIVRFGCESARCGSVSFPMPPAPWVEAQACLE